MAQVASWNEHGTVVTKGKYVKTVKGNMVYVPPHITPPRPFMEKGTRAGLFNSTTTLKKHIKKKGQKGAYTVLAKLVVAGIKKTIREYNTPPNSPLTQIIKGFNNPLIHTEKMLKSVKYKVK